MSDKNDLNIEEIKKMNLYEKLLNITNDIKSVAKNLEVGVGKNSYKAVGEADVLKAVKELEYKYRVYSYPSKRTIVDKSILETEKEYQGTITRSNQIFMRIEVEYTFVNIDKTEETIIITTYGDGVDSNDKGPGKAMTYADKYALLKAYKIVTGEDPDQNPSPDNTIIEQSNKNSKGTKKNTQKDDFILEEPVEIKLSDKARQGYYEKIWAYEEKNDLQSMYDHYKVDDIQKLNDKDLKEALACLQKRYGEMKDE